jgi:hypothetical protein
VSSRGTSSLGAERALTSGIPEVYGIPGLLGNPIWPAYDLLPK